MTVIERIEPRSGYPRVTVYPSGHVFLNAAAYRALGQPRYVSLYHIQGEVEIRAEREPAGAFALSRVNSGGAAFSSLRLARLAGGRLRLPAAVGDGFLRVRLADGAGDRAGDALRGLGDSAGAAGHAAARGGAEPGGARPA